MERAMQMNDGIGRKGAGGERPLEGRSEPAEGYDGEQCAHVEVEKLGKSRQPAV